MKDLILAYNINALNVRANIIPLEIRNKRSLFLPPSFLIPIRPISFVISYYTFTNFTCQLPPFALCLREHYQAKASLRVYRTVRRRARARVGVYLSARVHSLKAAVDAECTPVRKTRFIRRQIERLARVSRCAMSSGLTRIFIQASTYPPPPLPPTIAFRKRVVAV